MRKELLRLSKIYNKNCKNHILRQVKAKNRLNLNMNRRENYLKNKNLLIKNKLQKFKRKRWF